MTAPIIRTLCGLLLGASSTFASPLLEAREDPLIIYGNEVYYNGPYVFLGCSAQQGQELELLFEKTGAILVNTILPATQTPSQDPNQDPFVTFFSSNSRDTVKKVFNAMNEGDTVNGGGSQIETPNFICINEVSSPYLGDALPLCESKPFTSAFATGHPAVGTNIMFCPSFFTQYPQFPNSSENCPTVDFEINSAAFFDHKNAERNQFSTIIHELAHVYSPHPITTEIYDINLILYQTLEFQLNNANNYAVYAAMVYMGCQTYPYLADRHSTQGKLRARDELPAMSGPIGYRLEERQTVSTSTNTSVVPLADSQQYVTDDVPLQSLGNVDFDWLYAALKAAGYPPGYT